MKLKKLILTAALSITVATVSNANVDVSKPAVTVHTTHGGKEKGGNSSNNGSKSNPSNDSNPVNNNSKDKTGGDGGGNGKVGDSSKGNGTSSGNGKGSGSSNPGGSTNGGSGPSTKDRINVSEEVSRGDVTSSSSSSSKTVIDSYNWYLSNDGKLIPGLDCDWITDKKSETTQNISIDCWHAGHYKGIRHPNTHIETTTTITDYVTVEYEYKDPAGNIVNASRSEACGSHTSTSRTPTKEDTSITYIEEWEIPITGCDLGEECEPYTVTTPVPNLNNAEYDFDLEMTN